MGDVVRADHQSQDREGAQADDPADAATAGRSGHPVACSSNAANSCALLSASPRAPCPRTIAHSMPCGRGWTRGAASGTSRSAWRGKATTSSSPGMTTVDGEPRSTPAGWSTHPRARPARVGSARRGGPCRVQRGRRCDRPVAMTRWRAFRNPKSGSIGRGT